MENLDSEKEQLEQFKKWFQENGMSLVLGVVLGLGGVYGWRAWQAHQVTLAEERSAELAAAQDLIVKGEYEATATRVEELASENEGSLNADMSRLVLARARVEQGMLKDAVEPLKMIATNEKSIFKSLARLRLARVYLALSNLKEAEELIMANTENAYASAFEELRGDLERARGEYGAARAAYSNSLALADNGVNTQFLQMKMDDLPADK